MSSNNTSQQLPYLVNYRGVLNLAADAVIGVTDLVESFHAQALNSSQETLNKELRENSAASSIYRNIRRVTHWTNNQANSLIDLLELIPKKKRLSARVEAVVSVVNGVLGDHLVKSNNGLAISMKFKYQGFELSDSELLNKIRQSNGKLLVMVHGSCMNDLQWSQKGKNQAEDLANDLGMSALYIHYNSGLHISENGKLLSALLEKLAKFSKEPLEVSIVAHSMGGLISRSACYYADQYQHNWQTQIKNIIFLGTPHHGAPLEKMGNWIEYLLTLNSYTLPFASLAKVRSGGITDLRYGNLIDEDWSSQCRFKLSKDKRNYVALPESINCFSIAATTNKNSYKIGDDLIGDGLVTLNSALGKHPEFNLNFPKDRLWVARSLTHMDLLSHKDVYKKVKSWIS